MNNPTERSLDASDLLVSTAEEVAHRVADLGLPDGDLNSIAMCECPVAATTLAIKLLLNQRGFADDLNTMHKLLMQVAVLRNESPPYLD